MTSAFAGSYAVTAIAPSKSVPVATGVAAGRCACPLAPPAGGRADEAPTSDVSAPAMSVAAPCCT